VTVLTRRRAIELLEAAGTSPQRARGQNFVVDPNTIRKIVRLADVVPGEHVLEIGPGLGSLTLALAEAGALVTAVEVDAAMVRVLTGELSRLRDENPSMAQRITLHHVDAMNADWSALLAESPVWTLVANLPYNIATPLIADLLDEVPRIERMLVMVQAEVAQRLCAAPGSKAYGAVSVKVASWARAQVVATVPPTVFLPQPNVTSALVSLHRHTHPVVPPDLDRDALFALVRAGFGQRRKMLRRSLDAVVTAEAFERAEVDATLRAEALSLADWIRLAHAVAHTS
jgi:16S rRNA (adenine1518-N6/adenine1519-N6)-dimethyltransferase